uniref:Uncharacterized protein n=1 Tax=Pyxicephalus adspersus TaxID=30357 RepID=A0AAV3AAF5_PYXAD|nr:TPA: hypothetical protein GDO54_014711 [Pyxicephalus adspersus]
MIPLPYRQPRKCIIVQRTCHLFATIHLLYPRKWKSFEYSVIVFSFVLHWYKDIRILLESSWFEYRALVRPRAGLKVCLCFVRSFHWCR